MFLNVEARFFETVAPKHMYILDHWYSFLFGTCHVHSCDHELSLEQKRLIWVSIGEFYPRPEEQVSAVFCFLLDFRQFYWGAIENRKCPVKHDDPVSRKVKNGPKYTETLQ
jgi:hypothetical protein